MTIDRAALARQTHGGMLTSRIEEAADGLDELVQRLRALAQKDVPLVGTDQTAKTGAAIAQEALRLYTVTAGNLPLSAISRAGTEYDRALANVMARHQGSGLDETAEALVDQCRQVYEVYDGHIPASWSQTEQLAVAVVLFDFECARTHKYAPSGAERVVAEMLELSVDLEAWLDGVRAVLVAEHIPVYPAAPVENDLQSMRDAVLGELDFQPTTAQLRQVWRENPWLVAHARADTWSEFEVCEQLAAALTALHERTA
jgi:hypothetical protein